MKLQIKLLDPGLSAPSYALPGDAGLDLMAASPVTLKPGERALVATGVAVAIPPGHAGLVLPRSGRALREGLSLANSPGLIDPGYRGELKVVVVNLDPEEPIHIDRGDKVAQLVVQRVENAELVVTEELPPSERGSGGFGSSGR
ncbi:MAG: dUTP diphosphatase [Actinomycetota bacterium]|nr:dUTP diphosphatase [Actinomycetota bacterium]